MRQFPFQEFELFLTPDVTDIYDWFEVGTLNGLTKAEMSYAQTSQDRFVSSLVNYHPKDVLKDCSYKPFFYLNSEAVNELPIHEVAIIIHRAAIRLSAMLCEGIEDAHKLEEFAESISIAVCDELNMPTVYMKI